jgi:chromosome segregation ATPase
VRVRDNVVVPWWSEGESGLLVLRGVPRPARPGLGEALVGELARGAARLEAEALRQLERLRAATPPPAAAAEPGLEVRLAELEAEREALGKARDGLTREVEGLRAESESGLKALDAARHKLETAGLDLAAARQQGDDARRELEAAREDRRNAERELEAAKRELEAVPRPSG